MRGSWSCPSQSGAVHGSGWWARGVRESEAVILH